MIPQSMYLSALLHLKYLNVRDKTVELLENIGVSLHYLGLGNDFSVMTPKTQPPKKK